MEEGRGLLRLKPILARVWGENNRELGYIRTGCGEKSAASCLCCRWKEAWRAVFSGHYVICCGCASHTTRPPLACHGLELSTTFAHVAASP
ncbi:hypothetical protein IG631_09077 [Alternaria alternata]|nr:hypothetical protein IG631_09077 [Alternaria alternata]